MKATRKHYIDSKCYTVEYRLLDLDRAVDVQVFVVAVNGEPIPEHYLTPLTINKLAANSQIISLLKVVDAALHSTYGSDYTIERIATVIENI